MVDICLFCSLQLDVTLTKSHPTGACPCGGRSVLLLLIDSLVGVAFNFFNMQKEQRCVWIDSSKYEGEEHSRNSEVPSQSRGGNVIVSSTFLSWWRSEILHPCALIHLFFYRWPAFRFGIDIHNLYSFQFFPRATQRLIPKVYLPRLSAERVVMG